MSPVMDPIITWIGKQGKKHFSLARLIEETSLERRPALRVCDKLTREGFLLQVGDDPIPPGWGECGRERRNPTWKLVKGPITLAKPVRAHPSKRDRMWAYINDNAYFTVGDLQIILDDGDGQSHHAVTLFVHILRDNGYIRERGKRGREKLWKLVKGRGQDRPQLPEPFAGRRRKEAA